MLDYCPLNHRRRRWPQCCWRGRCAPACGTCQYSYCTCVPCCTCRCSGVAPSCITALAARAPAASSSMTHSASPNCARACSTVAPSFVAALISTSASSAPEHQYLRTCSTAAHGQCWYSKCCLRAAAPAPPAPGVPAALPCLSRCLLRLPGRGAWLILGRVVASRRHCPCGQVQESA